jgi:tRNA uridine 5-carboxymethylaminomethyl modification enzyme
MRFAEEWRLQLERIPNIDFWQEMVGGLIVKDGKVKGVRTAMGIEIPGKSVVLTNGTFLNGIIHIGEKKFGGGRTGEKAATGITEQLVSLGFESGRMKTGTPPRIDGRSLDYSRMEEQKGDENPSKFSFSDETSSLSIQKSCYITYTNKEVHEVLKTGFDRSPMYTGRIQGRGPRYCPSVEDKVNRFADKERHQIFVEPEGWDTIEIYVNGFSTSLPEDVQFKALRLIPGFENARMFRPGYAIEYDYFPPVQLSLTLETRLIENLYFAGQINGTTGYEEAACQGLIAGINAHNKVHQKDPFILKRSEAYIGVLIDDLVNKGTEEPYRMFTSRAEYRILLRQDNADVRLTPKGYQIGLATENRLRKMEEKKEVVSKVLEYLKKKKLYPKEINFLLESKNSAPIREKGALYNLIKRPDLEIKDLMEHTGLMADLAGYPAEILELATIEIKYEDYIQKEEQLAKKMEALENMVIPNVNYDQLVALSAEGKEKLKKIRPHTIGQASRISGVSPADISVLMVYLGR